LLTSLGVAGGIAGATDFLQEKLTAATKPIIAGKKAVILILG
jgi:hypothetical protein